MYFPDWRLYTPAIFRFHPTTTTFRILLVAFLLWLPGITSARAQDQVIPVDIVGTAPVSGEVGQDIEAAFSAAVHYPPTLTNECTVIGKTQAWSAPAWDWTADINPLNRGVATIEPAAGATSVQLALNFDYPGTYLVTLRANVLWTGNCGGRQIGRGEKTFALTVKTPDHLLTQAPDLYARNINDWAWIGNNIYNATGLGQMVSGDAIVDPDIPGVVNYEVQVQNDSNLEQSFRVKAAPIPAGWEANFHLESLEGETLTTAITGEAGWITPVLQPGETKTIVVEVVPGPNLVEGELGVVTVSASTVGAQEVDTVVLQTAATGAPFSISQPDLSVSSSKDNLVNYIGDDVYVSSEDPETNPNAQVLLQEARVGETAVYYITIENDGSQADSFRLVTAEARDGWIVRYFDAAEDGNEITATITSEVGWNVDALEPDASVVIRVEVQPQDIVDDGDSLDLGVTATSLNDESIIDQVTARTSTPETAVISDAKADLALKQSAETLYIGTGIYEVNSEEQSKTVGVTLGKTISYHVRLTNNNENVATFALMGTLASEGWKVHYYDALEDGQDISGEIEGPGWTTPPLAAGDSLELLIEVTAVGPPAEEGTCPLVVRVTQDDVVSDVVKMTTVLSLSKVDASISLTSAGPFIGNDIFNTNGEDQSLSQTVPTGEAGSFVVRIINKGDHAEPFTVLGLKGESNQQVHYFDDLLDITEKITANGWVTPELAPGAAKEIRVVIAPGTANSSPPGQIFAGLYHVHVEKEDVQGGPPEIREYNLILSAEDVQQIVQGNNVGPAHLAIGDPCPEMQVNLTPTSVAPAVLVQVTSTLDPTQVDIVKATVLNPEQN